MKQAGKAGHLEKSTMVWAQGMRQWVRLDAMRALMWFVISPGEAALSPAKRGIACANILLRLAKLRPSVDTEGVPVRPVPKVKRILSSQRVMPHLAQAILAGDATLTDLVCQLIYEVVSFNPRATVKLYTTGLFFFLLSYPGSNWDHAASLMHATHLRQSFFSEAASLGRETTLGRRSILGAMLPESIICVLANRGPGTFAQTFLSDVDNPEVIWKYAMRGQLIDMITQHLGELPARLRANPATIYDYCPIPRVTYEELDEELWCSNFYLRNLTDEARFANWTIDDPVMLLRAALDNWRLETSKTEDDKVDLSEAWKELGLEPGAEESDIRKAYRKLARKFHPDKNPAGRDRFMLIQRAYEALTTARPEAAAGGPDPVALLLLVRTQCILFKRHTKVLKPYKYAGYPLVMLAIRQLPKDTSISGDSGQMAESLTRLIYLTCLTSPRNAEELVREDGTEVLAELLHQLVRDVPFGTKALLAD